MTTVGLLAPIEPLPSEYERVLSESGCRVESAITPAADSHDLADVAEAGDLGALIPAAKQLTAAGADVVAWACTSGSFAAGLDAARRQRDALAQATGVQATTTTLALLDALAALTVSVVGVCSPYPWPVSERLCVLLEAAGVHVGALHMIPTDGPSISKQLSAAALSAGVAALGDVALAVVPDTAVPGCDLAPDIATSVPTLFANQWTIWHCLTLTGSRLDHDALGVLRGVRA